MANINVPVDGRPQFSLTDVAVNVGLGRARFDGFEQIAPDRYVVAGSWPAPRPSQPTSGAPSPLAASSPAPDRPKSPASALWPHLRP
jgi:hypothetical protein